MSDVPGPTHEEHPCKRIVAAVKDMNIRFTVSDRDSELDRLFYRRIELSSSDGGFSIPVEDDMEDVDKGNPAVLLNMVLREMKDFEEAVDYLEWCRDGGHKAGDLTARAIWFELRDLSRQVAEMFEDVEPLAHWDMEMNTWPMQQLRAAKF